MRKCVEERMIASQRKVFYTRTPHNYGTSVSELSLLQARGITTIGVHEPNLPTSLRENFTNPDFAKTDESHEPMRNVAIVHGNGHR